MRDVKTVREALAPKLAAALSSSLEGVEPWKPKALGKLPRAIIHLGSSPVVSRPGSLQVTHRFEVETVIALRSNIEAAMEALTPLIKTEMNALNRAVRVGMATDHGVNLRVTDYREDEAVYGGQPYITLVIGVVLNDVEGESFTP